MSLMMTSVPCLRFIQNRKANINFKRVTGRTNLTLLLGHIQNLVELDTDDACWVLAVLCDSGACRKTVVCRRFGPVHRSSLSWHSARSSPSHRGCCSCPGHHHDLPLLVAASSGSPSQQAQSQSHRVQRQLRSHLWAFLPVGCVWNSVWNVWNSATSKWHRRSPAADQ